MNSVEIISSLAQLGRYINQSLHPETVDNQLKHLLHHQHSLNNWHSENDLLSMLRHLGKLLAEESLNKWQQGFSAIKNAVAPKPALIKPNPNFSFGGIQEWLCCTITQTPLVLTANENQFQVLRFLCQKLIESDKNWQGYLDIGLTNSLKPDKFILYPEKKNDSIYQYFGNKKSVFVEPRPTIALLTGKETNEDLLALGIDIFMHLGQSNRTLRKIFIPEKFDIKKLIEKLEPYSPVYSNNKYANNYDYHQSVYLMNKIQFLDNGFLIFKEDASNDAPTGCIFYESYSNLDKLVENLKEVNYENLICTETLPLKTVKPGRSHFFRLDDYPNGKNLVEFMLNN